jgi:hypothetical protein
MRTFQTSNENLYSLIRRDLMMKAINTLKHLKSEKFVEFISMVNIHCLYCFLLVKDRGLLLSIYNKSEVVKNQ